MNIAANWAGAVTDSLGNRGTGTLTLSQNGDVLSGSFSLSRVACDSSGDAVGGTVPQAQVSLTKAPSNIYPVTLLLTLDSTHQQMTGSYSTSSGVCGSNDTATLTKAGNLVTATWDTPSVFAKNKTGRRFWCFLFARRK